METKPAVGDLVDRYFVLHREVSVTHHSLVYEAFHGYTGRHCIIKMLSPAARQRPHASERLLREARLLTNARSAPVPEVLAAGVCRTHGPYLAMELLRGRSLEGILMARHRLSAQEVTQLAYAACEALNDVHAAGIIHRDIKPGNIWITPALRGDRALLIDFDIATQLTPTAAAPRITRHGELLGTPEYMAAEQIMGQIEEINERSDVYALASTLFECLTGETPYPGGALPALHAHATRSRAPRPHDRDGSIPVGLSEAIAAALSHDPRDRPANARAFAASISQATGIAPASLRLLSADERDGGPQRRRHARAPYVTQVRLRAGGQIVDGHSEDLSEGGLLFVSPTKLPDVPELTARFALPSSGAIVDVPVQARWTRERRGSYAVGLEFLEMPAKYASEIAMCTLLLMARENSTPSVRQSDAA